MGQYHYIQETELGKYFKTPVTCNSGTSQEHLACLLKPLSYTMLLRSLQSVTFGHAPVQTARAPDLP